MASLADRDPGGGGGVDLRLERQRRGLSLDQVSQQSRIPVQYLDALESGEAGQLPRGPWLDSYRKQYLRYLGLPEQVAVSKARPVGPPPRLDRGGPGLGGGSLGSGGLGEGGVGEGGLGGPLLREITEDRVPRAAEPAVDEPTVDPNEFLRTRTITRQYDNVPVIRLVLAGFLATTALVLAMKLMSGLVDGGSATAAAPAAPAEASEASAEAAEAAEAAIAEAEPAEPEATPEPAAKAPKAPSLSPSAVPGMEVSMRATERVKVAVELDGEPVFDDWLAPGERYSFHGEGRIAVDVGDLTRLRLAYDGEDVEPLGNLSHPRRLVFVADSD